MSFSNMPAYVAPWQCREHAGNGAHQVAIILLPRHLEILCSTFRL